MAICGYDHGAIQIWDLITGEMQMEYRPEGLHPEYVYIPKVKHLAAAVCNGRRIVITAWNEGSLRVLDQADGTVLGTYSGEHGSSVTAMCVVSLEQETVLMAADEELALRVWRLPQLELWRERHNATAATIYSMVAMHFDGKPAVLSGGDSCHNGETVEQYMLRIWCP